MLKSATIAHLAVEVDFDVDDATAGAKRVTASIRDVEDAAQSADTNIGDLGDGLTRIRKNSVESAGAMGRLSNAFTALKGAGTVGILAAAIAALPAIAVAASGGIVLGLGGALAAVGIIGAAQSKKVKEAWTSEINAIKKTIRTISAPFRPVLTSIAEMVGGTFHKFVPELKSAFKDMAPAIEGFAGAFTVALQKLQPAIKPITDAFVRLLNQLGPKLPAIFEAIAGGLIAVANAIGQNPQKFINLAVAIGHLIGFVLRAIAFITRFSNIFLGLVIVLGIVAAAFLGPIGAVAGAIAIIVALTALIVMNFPKIKKAIISAWKAVKSFTISAWNAIKSFFVGVWNRIKNVVMGAVNAVKGFLARAWAAVRNRVVGAFQAIVRAVRGGVRRVVGFARSLPGKIRSAVGNLGRLLWNAGRAVIEGLINGIKSAFQWLRDTLSSVTSLIPDWKGPLSDDRRLLAPAGEAIMSGLIDGIAAQRGALRSELTGVGEDARGLLDRAAGRMGFGEFGAALTGRVAAPAGVRRAAARPTVLEIRSGGSRMDDLLVEVLRRSIRTRGGDVQVVLGGR